MIPTVETCLRLMDEYAMLDNIREHSRVVARVAELIASGFVRRGEAINIELVVAASLLHDIAKTPCLESRCDHARMGEEICRRHGYSEIAAIVAEHVLISSNGHDPISEKEIVYYADKRVNHDRVVSLHDRLAYILERYGRNDATRHASIMKNFHKCMAMEKRIFSYLDFAPGEVADLLRSGAEGKV
ncbi:MAG: HD domain-containing protein [Thermodesulfobacteriota bacterium]